MNRKTLAIFLSLAMILSLLAANGLAFAEDAHPEAPAEEPQVVEVEEKTEEPAEAVTEPEEKAEEVPEVTEPEEDVKEEPAEPVTEPEATEDETEEPEEKVEEPEVPEDPKEEVETPAEEPENPEEGEEPAPEDQPGEETETPEEPVVPEVPVAPVKPEEVEVAPEQNLPNSEVNDVVGGGNSGVEGLPVVPEVPQQPVCSCGVNEGEAHEEGCPMYEAPAQPAPVVPAVPVEGCTCGTLSEDPQDHDVDCPVFLTTINRLPAQVKHSELYIRIMACETLSDAVKIVENATEKEILELSEEEIVEINAILNAFSDSKVSEPELPEGIFTEDEVVESEIRFVMDEESENAVAAPFLPPVKGE